MALHAMIGMSVVSGFSFKTRAVSIPVMSGRSKSKRMRVGCSARSISTPCNPVAASIITYPELCRIEARISRKYLLSSTIRTFLGMAGRSPGEKRPEAPSALLHHVTATNGTPADRVWQPAEREAILHIALRSDGHHLRSHLLIKISVFGEIVARDANWETLHAASQTIA